MTTLPTLSESNNVLSLEQAREELLALKRKQAHLMDRKEKLIQANKLLYFRPNSEKQLQFFDKANLRRRGVFAGNRFGKSTLGVAEDLSWCMGYRPFFPKGHPLRLKGIPQGRGVRGLVIAQDWDRVRELFTDDKAEQRPGKFFEWAPENLINNPHRRQNGVIDQLYTFCLDDTGRERHSVVMFDTVKSFKADGLSQESLDWDFIHLDEPVPEDMYNAVARGLMDRGGYMWMLLTPLREIWMYNFMVQGQIDYPQYFWHAVADMHDNPEISEEEKELFLSNLSEAERNCREKGIPMAYGNLVYSTFSEERHVLTKSPAGWSDRFTPPSEWRVIVAIDTHPQTPHAVLFIAVSPTSVVIFREIWRKCLISELCVEIRQAIRGLRVTELLCDRMAWIADPVTGGCWADIFFDYGLDVQPASKQKEIGILQTKEIWSPQFEKQVYVLDSCRHFIREIKNYFFDKEDKPADKDDHLMECLYRSVILDNLCYVPPATSGPIGIPLDDVNVDMLENEEATMQL